MKYFKGSDWLKDSTKLHFNPDATALADLIPGKVDENSNFIVSDRMDETQLSFTSEGFDDAKKKVASWQPCEE